ncbi:nucleotidyltransferase domain-containing protein [Thalassobacillus sp. B23F22_16]|uniref:nucleotidyltransferase domain-containing protein n=1 Tax=Thalassobacillus sp. B23F22_16 TaxID=3459513 RepID=UPI00373F170F
MRQERAVQMIVDSLKRDSAVQSVFLKGSMGRQEHDEHSDIDLYCMVKEEEEKSFLSRRLDHLTSYREIIFYDDIFIIAPQIIAVYDDWLHIDLFTVTEESFQNKDYFTVLYDPENTMKYFEADQHLSLPKEEFHDHVLDVAWFLFQYKKASERGNDTWAVEMLRQVMRHLSYVVLHRYVPGRAMLGLKALPKSLPAKTYQEIKDIYEYMTPSSHRTAAKKIACLLNKERSEIETIIKEEKQTVDFLNRMVDAFHE